MEEKNKNKKKKRKLNASSLLIKLLTRIELVTSALPMRRTTDCATTACTLSSHEEYYSSTVTYLSTNELKSSYRCLLPEGKRQGRKIIIPMSKNEN